MHIQLFRSFSESAHLSMKVYADHLMRELAMHLPNDSVTSFSQDQHVKCITKVSALDRRWNRYVHIPRLAQKAQGDVNHILDHAESHLLHHLDLSKTLITCHDIIPTKLWHLGYRLMARHHYWMSKRKIAHLKKATLIVSDSDATRQDLIALYQLNEDKIRTIYPGLSDHFKPVDKEMSRIWLTEQFGIPKDVPLLLNIAGNFVYKNIDGLLKELAQIGKEEWFFLKVGRDFTPSQQAIIEQGNLRAKVGRIGYVEEADLPRIYSAADLFLFPSLYEGFGWPPLEAMACGTPVLCSDRGSLKEAVGTCALIIDPDQVGDIAQNIRRFLKDMPSEEKTEMINSGQMRAQTFTWKRTVAQLYQCYQELAEN